jgi:hypothetical protein
MASISIADMPGNFIFSSRDKSFEIIRSTLGARAMSCRQRGRLVEKE